MFIVGIFVKISLEKCFPCFLNFKRKVENKYLLFSKFSLLKFKTENFVFSFETENVVFSFETENFVFSFLTSKHVFQILYENEKFLFFKKVKK